MLVAQRPHGDVAVDACYAVVDEAEHGVADLHCSEPALGYCKTLPG